MFVVILLEVNLTLLLGFNLQKKKRKEKDFFFHFSSDCQQGKAKLAFGSVSLAPSGINEEVSQRL